MEQPDREKLNAIYYEIVGQPEFNRKGLRKQTDENTEEIKQLKDGNFKRNVVTATIVSVATAIGTWFSKSAIVKAIGTGLGANEASKMIK